MVITWSTRQPRSAVRRCRKLLKSSPAEITSTTVSAISTVSIVLRRRAREAPPPTVREDSRSPDNSPLPVEEIAGTRPASSAAAATRANVKARTHPSTCTESARGRLRQWAASQ